MSRKSEIQETRVHKAESLPYIINTESCIICDITSPSFLGTGARVLHRSRVCYLTTLDISLPVLEPPLEWDLSQTCASRQLVDRGEGQSLGRRGRRMHTPHSVASLVVFYSCFHAHFSSELVKCSTISISLQFDNSPFLCLISVS